MSKIQKALDRAIRQNSLPENRRSEPVKSTHSLAVMRESNLASPATLESRDIVHSMSVDRKALESYHALRTRLGRELAGSAGKVICVTSVVPATNDVMVALNLSVSVAGDESQSALIVDCDLDRPSVAKILGLADAVGLTDFIEGNVSDIANIILGTGIPRLRAITAGYEPYRSDIFLRRRMKEMIAEVRERYDDRIIILHAPPVMGSSDAIALAEQSDWIILTVPYGKATSPQVMRAIEAVGPSKVMGTVLYDEPQLPPLPAKLVMRDVLEKLAHPLQMFRTLFGAERAH
jgi:Mrp family chromosome partitioning ATPase